MERHLGPLITAIFSAAVGIAAGESKAWTSFVNTGPSVLGEVGALNLAARRAGAAGDQLPVPSGKVGGVSSRYIFPGKVPGTSSRWTANDILQFCKNSTSGSLSIAANAAKDAASAPPACYYCFTQGYGTRNGPAGIFFPCGCQNSCVNAFPNMVTMPGTRGILTKSGSGGTTKYSYVLGKSLQTCDDYIQAKVVYPCSTVATYHVVLWMSLIVIAVLIYTAYSMMYMPLDMDSLLYMESGSSEGKKDL